MLYNTTQLDEMTDAFNTLNNISHLQSVYITMSGCNLFLMLLRIFKLLDFQPRMGVLTRTLAKALDDLVHFGVLLALVYTVYTVMGYVIFGPTIKVVVREDLSV